jgi:hypothetical protein
MLAVLMSVLAYLFERRVLDTRLFPKLEERFANVDFRLLTTLPVLFFTRSPFLSFPVVIRAFPLQTCILDPNFFIVSFSRSL